MNIPQEAVNIIVTMSIVIGVIQCFHGYRVFKFILAITGFLIGGSMAASVGFVMFNNELASFLTGVVGGLIGSALMLGLFYVGIFIVGAFLGIVVGAVFFAVVGSDPEPVAMLLLALISGVMALIFQKFMIIFSTGFGGAWSVIVGIFYFTMGSMDLMITEQMLKAGNGYLYAALLCWIVLGIGGVIVQYKSASPKEKQQPKTQPRSTPEGETQGALPFAGES